jgi:dihydropteroate synthase-like protein
MADKLLFLTGRLAEPRLKRTVADLGLPDGTWRIANLGVKVAALMTEAIVRNRLKGPLQADRVIVPGRSRMDLAQLKDHYGVPFERGPDEIVDLPQYFGNGGKPPDLSRHDMRIFAEIVEAPQLTVAELVARAGVMKDKGADVIDIGCQPGVPFPHLEDMVCALKTAGHTVSVDSGDVDELRRGAQAGADFVLSLDETSLDAIAGTRAVPILLPRPHGDLNSLIRAIDLAKAKGIPHIADPVLDPIHFGFTASLERYAALRRARPDVEILMGTGNLTELTDADSQGVTVTLLGICSELLIRNVLIVQVSPHTRRTLEEHDAARRLIYRARQDESLPKGYGGRLLSLHELRPYPETPEQIAAIAQTVRDANFRIEVAVDGIHVYNREGHHVAKDPYELFDKLGVEKDGAHAFYLGYELAKAEIAYQLGKRYTQDGGLDWGVAADRKAENLTRHATEGATLKAARKERADAAHRRDDRDDDKR